METTSTVSSIKDENTDLKSAHLQYRAVIIERICNLLVCVQALFSFVKNCPPRHFDHWPTANSCLGFRRSQICRPPLKSIHPHGCWRERQSMSDKTLSISAALREAQLQRLEASLASKAAMKAEAKIDRPQTIHQSRWNGTTISSSGIVTLCQQNH